MNDLNDAQDWRDVAQHLVEAHGADSGGLTGYAPTLEQLRFAHADTHIALASIGALPPDRHTHPVPVDAGWCDPRPESYRPFPPSPAARRDPLLRLHGFFPLPSDTGLPHTGCYPASEADLTDWAGLSSSGTETADMAAYRRDWITEHAAAAVARWRARADFPGPVQTQPRSSAMPDPDDRMTTWPEAGSPGTAPGAGGHGRGCRRGQRYRRLPEPYARVRRAFPRGRRLAAGPGWPRNTAHGGASGRCRVRRQPLYYRYQLPARDPGRGETSARRNRGPACRRRPQAQRADGNPGPGSRGRQPGTARWRLISRPVLRLARPLTLPGQPCQEPQPRPPLVLRSRHHDTRPVSDRQEQGQAGGGQPGKPAVAWAGPTSSPSRSRQHIQFRRCRCCGHRLRRVPATDQAIRGIWPGARK